MNEHSIAFVGAGNMAGAIIGGLLDAGYDPGRLSVSAPSASTRERWQARALGRVEASNTGHVAQADVVVLGMKPRHTREVCLELAPVLHSNQVVLSLVAGIRSASIRQWLGDTAAVVRSVPNTPALLRAGVTGMYADSTVGADRRQRAEAIMKAVGEVIWVTAEELLDTVTAVSGSGPAYFFQFVEAMIDEAIAMGLDAESARTLCSLTCLGAGSMLAAGEASAAELRRRVCSPGGTTERAVASFAEAGIGEIVAAAMRAARARSVEMGDELS